MYQRSEAQKGASVMQPKITTFPVGNGAMTLIQLGDDSRKPTTILIDCCISENGGSECDVASELRDRLPIDKNGRPYVDAFCLSHPDDDHCRGLEKHFHLGPLADYEDDPKEGEQKIVIREMWSSPLVFRRRSSKFKLDADAMAWRDEANRRIQLHRDRKKAGKGPAESESGNRVILFGKDLDDKRKNQHDDIPEIVREVDESFTEICSRDRSGYVKVDVLGPLPKGEVDEDEDKLASNRSSIILRFHINPFNNSAQVTSYLTGGDAEVGVWVRLWEKYKKTPNRLEYDILLSPHHCSWHVLADQDCSWSKGCRTINKDARSALSQIRTGGTIISSSKPISDDDSDPPCVGAANEYKKMAQDKKGEFLCTGECPSEDNPEPLEILITASGHQVQGGSGRSSAAAGAAAAFSKPVEHG